MTPVINFVVWLMYYGLQI